MRPLLLSLSLCLGLLLPAAARPATTPRTRQIDLTTVTVATGFIPSVQFAPYYLAVDKGYYRARGLDVRIINGPNPALPRQTADGKIDFIITSGDALVAAHAAGIPVTYVMAQFQRYPVGALAIAGNGPPLRAPSDLKGRTIGISMPGSPTYIGLRVLLRAGHLTERDVKVISIGFTESQSLIHKQVDVAMTYLTNEPAQVRALGYKTETLDTSRYITLISTGLATSDHNVRANPDLVRRMVAATLQGLRDTQVHPDAALAASLKRMPEIAGDARQVDIQRQILAATLPYEQPPDGRPLGWSDPLGWRTTVSFLTSIGVVKGAVDPATLYTNRFAAQAAPTRPSL